MSDKPFILYRVSNRSEQPVDISTNNVKGSSLTTLEIDANWKSVADAIAKRANENNPVFNGILKVEGTGAVALPGGTNAERDATVPPTAAVDGMIRWNTEVRAIEYYDKSYRHIEAGGSVIVGGWRRVASIAHGSNDNYVYFVNDNEVRYDTNVMGENQNAVSAGPVSIREGKSLTIGESGTLTII